MALSDIRLGYKNQAWFDANADHLLKEGQVVYLEQTGRYKIGDGATTLSTLTFLGGNGTGGTNNLYEDQAWFDANPTLVLEEGQVAFLEQTGRYKLGDGVTQLQTLAFLGSGGGVRFDSNTAGFPVTGEIEVIYVAKDTGLIYQWNGLVYVELSARAEIIPSNGTIRQVLTKLSSSPYDLAWKDDHDYLPISSGLWRGSLGLTSYNNVTGNFNFIWLTPYFTRKPHTVTQIRTWIETGVAGGNIRLGLYASNGLELGNLIEDSGNIPATTQGFASYAFAAPTQLTDAMYYMALTVSSNTINIQRFTQGGVIYGITNTGVLYSCAYKSGAGFNPLPTTITSPVYASGNNMYSIQMLIQ